MSSPPTIAGALAAVRERIDRACDRSSRPRDTVELIAVSKTMPAERVQEAIAAGQRLFGENRVQEALEKQGQVSGVRWHLIGHLQRNKARLVTRAFELIHSVDDERLLAELDRRAGAAGAPQAILLQVNLSDEPTKAGVKAKDLRPLVDRAVACPHLALRGLMTIPPPVEQPEQNRRYFAELRELGRRAEAWAGAALPELSMGMTGDYEVAVEEGATLVRVGRAIFGER